MGFVSRITLSFAIFILVSLSLSSETYAAAEKAIFRVPMNYVAPVPMDRPELLPFAQFTNGFIELKKVVEESSESENSDEKAIEQWIANYQLPLALTGRPISVEMKLFASASNQAETKNQSKFAGEKANMTCLQSECSIQFRNLDLDSKQVEDFIRSHFPKSEIESRLALAASFELDPGGVIQLIEELPPLSP